MCFIGKVGWFVSKEKILIFKMYIFLNVFGILVVLICFVVFIIILVFRYDIVVMDCEVRLMCIFDWLKDWFF